MNTHDSNDFHDPPRRPPEFSDQDGIVDAIPVFETEPERMRPAAWEASVGGTLPFAEEITPIRSARPPHPGFRWALLWCLGYLVVTQLLPGIVAVVILFVLLATRPGGFTAADLAPENLKNANEYRLATMIAILLGQVLSIAGSWLTIRLVVGKSWPRILALRWPSWTHVVLALLGLPGLMFLTVGVDGLIKSYVPSIINLEETMGLFASWPWPLAVLIIGVGPGIGEELWCRGFLGRGLVGRHGVVGGVLLTSLLFGLIHLEPRQVFYAAFVGVLLHLAYLATRSLLVPMILHISNNSLSVLATPSFLEIANRPAEELPWHFYLAAALLVAAVGWALFKSRTRLADLPGEQGESWVPPYPGVAYPPLDSSTRVVHPAPNAACWLAVGLAAFIFAGSLYVAA